MNTLKKAYCRTFQFIFKMAIPLLPYRDPEVLDRVEDVPELLKRLGRRSVLLVTDRPLRDAGVTAHLEEALEKKGIHFTVYDGVCPNPTIDNIEEAVKLFRRNN